jgi:phenylalanyl-tRNA synthetase beta chain
MKISWKWLNELVKPGISPAEAARRLTMAGIETTVLQTAGQDWGDKVIVAQITDIKPHPNADRLRLATVDTGKGNQTVVCGAPNLVLGDKVAFAMVGAVLKDGHTGQRVQLKPAKIRGVASEGMVCAEKELGLSDNYEGILVLPKAAPLGLPLADYLGDAVLEAEVTPNRPDCLSAWGLAWEMAALTGQAVIPPALDYPVSGHEAASLANVEIADAALCPRYCASILLGVKVGPSPQWMQDRLSASGMRPINNIVDVTNYVMLEMGQPLHAFDYDRLKEHRIIVRPAQPKEMITSLDGTGRELAEGMLVIADPDKPVAIAGVMGGLFSEISEGTVNVLLESANFNGPSLRRTANTLKMRTEASYRFERGLSRELPPVALKRATRLLLEAAGGQAAPGIIDMFPGRPEPVCLAISLERVNRLLGVTFEAEPAASLLRSLGCAVDIAGEGLTVRPPWWRTDLNCEADIAEELARINGYDRIPITRLASPLPAPMSNHRLELREKIRDIAVSLGFQEIITYTLSSRDHARKLEPENKSDAAAAITIANPLSQEQDIMRPSLRGNVLASLSQNAKFNEDGIRLFELGKVFNPPADGGDPPSERESFCAVLGGSRLPVSWRNKGEEIDFFDARGAAETLLDRLGIVPHFKASEEVLFHPGRAAKIMSGKRTLGILGELHPRVLQNYEINRRVYLIELDLEAIAEMSLKKTRRYVPLPRFPLVERDIAILAGFDVSWAQIEEIVGVFPLVTACRLFDVYVGEPVPEDKKSVAFRVTYGSPTHTLKDEEVNSVHRQILEALNQKLGASLRA